MKAHRCKSYLNEYVNIAFYSSGIYGLEDVWPLKNKPLPKDCDRSF